MGVWQKAVASVISASPRLQLGTRPLVTHFLPLAGPVSDGLALQHREAQRGGPQALLLNQSPQVKLSSSVSPNRS